MPSRISSTRNSTRAERSLEGRHRTLLGPCRAIAGASAITPKVGSARAGPPSACVSSVASTGREHREQRNDRAGLFVEVVRASLAFGTVGQRRSRDQQPPIRASTRQAPQTDLRARSRARRVHDRSNAGPSRSGTRERIVQIRGSQRPWGRPPLLAGGARSPDRSSARAWALAML